MTRVSGPDAPLPEHLPASPGVYLLHDAGGQVIYVGKAVNLRSRVRSYFLVADDGRPRYPQLVRQVADVEVVVTGTEKEALLLENSLISKLQPRFNVRLRDDKTWLSIRIDPRRDWPRPALVRRWRDDGARYFGPYLNGVHAREVERLIRKAFGLRTCTDAVLRAHRRRPCIQHDMGNCVAPCVGRVTRAEYDERVRQVMALLAGRNRDRIRVLERRMHRAAEETRFEEAAEIRDRIRLMERIAERQRVQQARGRDRDVFGLYRVGDAVTVVLLPQRDGTLQPPRAYTFQEVLEEDGAVLQQVIMQLAERASPARQLLLPVELPDAADVADILSHAAGRRVRLRVPRRGDGVSLVQMATDNARARHQRAVDSREQIERGLAQLQRALRLPGLPRRVECYDISHLGGSDTVASMVVLDDGEADRASYRTFGIRGLERPDDYAAMRQVMERRLARVQRGWVLPDLIVVDGGKGQLGVAVAAARDAGIEVPVVALAKPDAGEVDGNPEATDKVFVPGRKNPVRLKPHSAGLLLLQRVRDEAHRVALRHQRGKRRKRVLSTELESIPGVGPGRARSLLRHFGSVRAVRAATAEEIAAVPGIGERLAETVARALAPGAGGAAAGDAGQPISRRSRRAR